MMLLSPISLSTRYVGSLLTTCTWSRTALVALCAVGGRPVGGGAEGGLALGAIVLQSHFVKITLPSQLG